MIGAFAERAGISGINDHETERPPVRVQRRRHRSRDIHGKQYGDRLNDAVTGRVAGSPEAIIEGVMDDVTGFVGDAPRSDDITMLALKRMP